jgi:RNA polymerase-binding transcription factor DksA
MKTLTCDNFEVMETPTNGHRATTAEILNLTSAPARRNGNGINPKWRKNYEALLELRAALLEQSGRLARTATEEIAPFSMHMADSGTDSFDRDFALGMLSSTQDSLFEIEEAIKRIENGTYGICELTGRPIASGRLNAVPWTRFSISAQKQLEKEGALGHTHLGSLRAVERDTASDADTDGDDLE